VPTTDINSQRQISPGSSVDQVASSDSGLPEFRAKLIKVGRLFWDQRLFLAKMVTVGLLIGVLFAFLLPQEFESETQLMPPDNQSSSGMLMSAMGAITGGGTLGSVAGDVLGIKNSGALFVGVLRSRTVLNRLVQRFDLKKVYKTRFEAEAEKELADNTTISEDHKSGIITIWVTDHDRQRAAAMAQAYVDELDRVVTDASTSAAHRERVFLEARLKAVKEELDEASQDFSEFASKNAAIDIKEQGKAMVGAAATLQGELIAAESQLKGLETIYSSSNVRVRSTEARVDELRRQLNDLGGKTPGGVSQSSDAAGSLYPSIRELPILGVKYADLYRRNKIAETVYETLTQQYELAKVQEAKEIPSVKVLDPANVPERRSFPPRVMIFFLCACCAFAVGAVAVFARAQWEQTPSTDPGKIFATEVFHAVNANMPWASPNGSRIQAATHGIWVRLVHRREHDRDAERRETGRPCAVNRDEKLF
jgi:uncharacterized protein involved in exopolysaccharide biosynthesis